MKISPVLSIFQVRAEMDVTVLVLEWQEALSLRQDDFVLGVFLEFWQQGGESLRSWKCRRDGFAGLEIKAIDGTCRLWWAFRLEMCPCVCLWEQKTV